MSKSSGLVLSFVVVATVAAVVVVLARSATSTPVFGEPPVDDPFVAADAAGDVPG